MTYKEALRYLGSFYNYEIKPPDKKRLFNLDRIRILTNLFNNPQETYKSIHIAGTKGKGSTASILSHVLASAGYKTALYTSPHLLNVRERFKINNKDIGEKEFAKNVKRIRDKLKKSKCEFKPSYFEMLTILAFNYFKEKKADFAIFETGLGGRLDATNIICPIVSVITSISYDHTKELGRSLKEIAREKAGIIKRGVECVSAPQKNQAAKAINDICKKLNSKLHVAGKSFPDKYRNVKLPLLGAHQSVNCAVSLSVIELLLSKGYNISKSAVYKGIRKTRWPGRCEVINKKPAIILDCAHNKASANAVKKAVISNFKFNKLILILGILRDKDIKGICKELGPFADKIILTKINSSRAARPEYIKKFLKKPVIISKNAGEAYNIAKTLAGRNDIILVTGSIYLVGEFKAINEQSK